MQYGRTMHIVQNMTSVTLAADICHLLRLTRIDKINASVKKFTIG